MKLVVAGSRHFCVEKVTQRYLNDPVIYSIFAQAIEVVSGKAKGVDTAGEQIADSLGLPVIPFPPDTEHYTYGRACNIRNNKMAVYGDALLLIWNGKSPGSQHMKNAMLALGKPVYEFVFTDEEMECPKNP